MLTNKFPIWKISTEKLWRKAKRHHVKPEPTNKERARWDGAQIKDKTHPNPPKPLHTDNKANTLCRSYLQCVEMLSRVQHELLSAARLPVRSPVCVWARACVLWKDACVISPWKVFPHSRDPTSLWQRGGGRRRARSVWWSAVTAEEQQGPLEFPPAAALAAAAGGGWGLGVAAL